ncbi:MAG TPA: hypothetical protein VJU58_15040, partial [Microbacterium sp.]|nr:hypothetical protein [Microbacterium sp.]
EPPEAAAFAAVAAFTARRGGAVPEDDVGEQHPSPPAASEATTEPIDLPRSAPPGARDGSQ